MEQKLDTFFQIKQINEDDKYGYFEGYASIFDVIDSYRDVVKKGAFTGSIERRKNTSDNLLPMLWSHETNNPIGCFSLDEMYEDDLGLFVKGKISLSIPQGRTAYSLLKDGICKKMSIGYRTLKAIDNKENNTRELIELELFEISLVMFPANNSARILNVKSMNLEDLNVSSLDTKEREDNINKILENNEFKAEDFYLYVNGEKKEGLFINIVNGEPEINIKAVVNFARKSNIENLSLSDVERKDLELKLNKLFSIIRQKTNDLSYISPFEVQQNIISQFTIKDCERFLKKSGLTNAGFKAFFSRLAELKSCGKRKKPEKKEDNIVENNDPQNIEQNNSLEEKQQTPEEFKTLNDNLTKLSDLLKN